MTVHTKKGSVVGATENIIAHQVNCRGVMGAGLAKALKDAYPNLVVQYRAFCNLYSPHDLLGRSQLVKVGDDKFIANLFGQLNYGRDDVRYTDYDALKQTLVDLKKFAKENQLSIALPYGIGCGLANGDWGKVSRIIEKVFSDYDVTLYQFE